MVFLSKCGKKTCEMRTTAHDHACAIGTIRTLSYWSNSYVALRLDHTSSRRHSFLFY
jgi:hypothetical protein